MASCLKHYLGYGASQAGKDYAYVDLSERSIREFHLPPFAAGVAAGAPSVMPAFTTGPGGVPMSANRRMLQDVLRGELGFDGVLVSDYAAITELRYHGTAADDLQAAVQALRDGTMTVDMEDGVYFAQLAKAVERKLVRVEEIDREVLRALAFKRRLGLFEKPYVPEDLEKRVRVSQEHRAAARDIARKSIVLLKNDADLLPLATPRRILLTGPLADARDDLLGPWHARGEGKDVVSVLAAFQERAAASRGAMSVTHSAGVGLERNGSAPPGDDLRIAAAVASARDSDVVIAVVGERETQSGEAKNRATLDLPGNQQALIDALLATGKPVVVVLLTGRALAVPAAGGELPRTRACILSGHRRRTRHRRRAVRRLQPGRQTTGHLAAQRRAAAHSSLRSTQRPAQHPRARRLQGALARRVRRAAVRIRIWTLLQPLPSRGTCSCRSTSAATARSWCARA